MWEGAVPSISGGTIYLTYNTPSNQESRTLFDDTPQNVSQFNLSVTYQATANEGGGAAIVLENSPFGVHANTNIPDSVFITLESPGSISSSGLYSGPSAGGSSPPTAPVVLNSGDPILVNLSYNGSILHETLTDTTSLASYSTSYFTDIPSIVGGDEAYVGLLGYTVFNGTLDQLTSDTEVLPVTDDASDYTVEEWLAQNDDNENETAPSSGEQTLTDKVQVVTPWTAQGTWTAGQPALVKANADGASLQQLALDITGNAADASLLGNLGTITKGQEIDVTPLLDKLSANVAKAAIAASNGPNVAEFPEKGNADIAKNPANYQFNNMQAAQIMSIFGRASPTFNGILELLSNGRSRTCRGPNRGSKTQACRIRFDGFDGVASE